MKDLPERECEECGSTENVSLRYGRETCDAADDWFGCWSCFSPYWDIRVHGDPSSTSNPGGKPTGQATLFDY